MEVNLGGAESYAWGADLYLDMPLGPDLNFGFVHQLDRPPVWRYLSHVDLVLVDLVLDPDLDHDRPGRRLQLVAGLALLGTRP